MKPGLKFVFRSQFRIRAGTNGRCISTTLRGIHPLINRLPPRSTTAIFAFHPSTRVPDICYFNYFAGFYCCSCLLFFFSSFSWIPRLVVASVRAQCLLPFKLVNDRERAKLWFEIALEYRRPKRIMVIEREKFFSFFFFSFLEEKTTSRGFISGFRVNCHLKSYCRRLVDWSRPSSGIIKRILTYTQRGIKLLLIVAGL